MSNKNKIFLGGTCAKTTWRNELISKLNSIPYFNPVVEAWTSECQIEEIKQKEIECNIHFYCILTKEQVLEIKQKYIPYKYSAKKLSKEYNVSESCITHILNNTSWQKISTK